MVGTRACALSSSVVLLFAMCAAGCGKILGLDEGKVAAGGSSAADGGDFGGGGSNVGGGTNVGGSTNTGGAGGNGGLTPADWIDQVDAFYPFEPPAIAGSPNGVPLSSEGMPSADPSNAPEGESSALLLQDDFFSLTTGDFASDSMTIAGWFKVEVDVDVTLVGRFNGQAGFFLKRSVGGMVECTTLLAASPRSVVAPTGMALETWTHVACVRNGNSTSLYIGGVLEAGPSDLPMSALASTRLELGDAEYVGNVDEFFFLRGDVSAASIARIFACGVAGSECTCDPADAAGYLDPGRGAGLTLPLPPCNQQRL